MTVSLSFLWIEVFQSEGQERLIIHWFINYVTEQRINGWANFNMRAEIPLAPVALLSLKLANISLTLCSFTAVNENFIWPSNFCIMKVTLGCISYASGGRLDI